MEEDKVENFVEELQNFHGEFADGFARSEPRGNFFDYTVGRFSHLERKSDEPIAVSVNGINSVRSMQRTISDAVWYEDKILYRYQDMVSQEMGDPDGVLMFDESGFLKKGECSAGVARQYCGEAGKVENCQNGVFAGYASPKGYVLLDKRLFIPGKWFEDDYEDRRNKCGIPEDIIFKSKPELAAEMYRDTVGRDAVPFRYVVADTVYGN
ncbi:MAG: transposase, partial [Desulfobacteraceae bacterium]|nr:transposase [Desulfobacteraceae bacterium]